MFVKIEKERIAKAAARAAKIALTRNLVAPILHNVLLEARNHEFTLTAADGQMFLTQCVEQEVIVDEGAVCVNARDFAAIVPSLAAEIIEISDEKKDVLMVYDANTKFTLPIIPADQYPSRPWAEGAQFFRPRWTYFVEIIEKVVHAAAPEGSPRMNAVLIEAEGMKMRMVATDGFRLALAERDVGTEIPLPDRQVLLSRRVLDALRQVLEEESCEIAFDDVNMYVKTQSFQLVARLSGVPFPDYRRIIPPDFTANAVVPWHDFVGAVRRTLIMSPKDSGNRISIKLGEHGITLRAEGPQQGACTDFVPYPSDFSTPDEGLEVFFNGRLLLDMANAMKTDIMMQLSNDSGPAVFKPAGGDNEIYIIMPMVG